ncbi:MAG: hypothetical protein KatS3mg111_0555 [Pirellulaceae bacterium]|nr:MAG: hypothetical protein KatS3mg111_0555 [Pirellulaceae bacterium]
MSDTATTPEPTSKSSAPAAKPVEVVTLKTQKVDIVASLLLSLLYIIGLVVFLLFIVWLTENFTWRAGDIKVLEENVAGRGDHAEGFERDIEPPGAEEVEELAEPSLAETLEAVTEAATSVAASVDAIDSNSMASVTGTGRGDSRPPGPLGEGDDIVPRFERWELKFQAKGLKQYAEQLDFYKIELACIGGGVSTVDYAFNFTRGPQKRSGTSAEENKLGRLYFMWRTETPLRDYERQLLQQAGIPTQGRQMLKFIPKDLENLLANIELEYAKSKGHSSVKEIEKTVFESRPTASGFEFTVIEQRYRTPRG